MKRINLFDKKIEILISEISDGNMRFFGEGDELRVIENQKKLGAKVGLNKIVRIRTIYGERKDFTEYQEITESNFAEYNIENPEERILVSDGLVTECADVGILLPLADCLGAVVFDEKQEIVGLLHAGRHNVEQDGPRKFIEFFVERFGSDVKNLKIYFSPHAVNYQISKLNKTLSEAAKEQFVGAGVFAENIVDPKIDTVSNENFPSHSSGDVDNRFAIVVRLI